MNNVACVFLYISEYKLKVHGCKFPDDMALLIFNLNDVNYKMNILQKVRPNKQAKNET